MRASPASALLLTCVVSIATACTTSPGAKHATKPAIEHTATPETAPNGRALGAPGCRPASPVTFFDKFLPQVQGTGHGATLWGLLMFPHPLPARVGDKEKIVWRMTGTAWPLTLAAIGPDGKPHRPLWGPAFHTGSNFDKPGDEWGAGYLFTEPGCWDLHAVRGRATADVWLTVIPRTQGLAHAAKYDLLAQRPQGFERTSSRRYIEIMRCQIRHPGATGHWPQPV